MGIPAEIDILSSVSHPNIVSYVDHFEDEKAYYLVMEKFGKNWKVEKDQEFTFDPLSGVPPQYSTLSIISGTSSSLFEYIDSNKTGKVPLRSQKPLFKQIATCLYYLHQSGIVHGDLKEENILIGTKSGRLVAKICDFGHSSRVNQRHPKMRLYGTRVLTPPELLNHLRAEERGELCSDPLQFGFKQDIWALGIVFWTMIHGCLPPENEMYINGQLSVEKHEFYPSSFKAVSDPGTSFIL